MAKPPSSPLAAIRDILVGTTVETAYEEPSSAIGYGLTLAKAAGAHLTVCLLYTSPSPRDGLLPRMPSSA